jgi:Uncharacterized conserved protein (COG2071)
VDASARLAENGPEWCKRIEGELTMRIPVIEGLIDRRILVNYRVDPIVLAKVLPPPFKPKLIHGHGVAGICLIRLKQIRPRLLRVPVGVGSENAAHRIAVEWESNGRLVEGVFVPRRDTNSRFSAYAGGRLFPGEQHHASFQVREADGQFAIAIDSDDGQVQVSVAAELADRLPSTSVFASLAEASEFFEKGGVGYSATSEHGRYDGMELRCRDWQMMPLDVMHVESSFFSDSQKFPHGSATFDCALLMRGIEHEWHTREDICCGAASGEQCGSASDR